MSTASHPFVCGKSESLIYRPTPITSSRSNLPYLLKPTNATKNVLSVRLTLPSCIDAWINALPASLLLFSSLSALKRGLKNIDLTRYWKDLLFIMFNVWCLIFNSIRLRGWHVSGSPLTSAILRNWLFMYCAVYCCHILVFQFWLNK